MSRLFILLIAALFFACQNGEQIVKPEQKPLIEAVYASGHVVAENEYEVFAQAEGYVIEKLADDGDEIETGAPLYILESGQQSSRFDLAKKNYAIAQENYREGSAALREVEALVEAARTRMLFDSVNHVRYNNLLDRQATSRGEYDRMRLAYESSRAEYELQRSRYRQVKNKLFLELESARSQLTIAGNESGKYIIRSEVSGKIFSTLKETGERIRRGEAVAVVGNRDGFYLQLMVDELDIRKVTPGQEILVTIDALPHEVFTARVQKVYPMVDRRTQSVRVDAALQDTIPLLVSGLAVEANIVISKKEKALVVPRSALIGRDTLRIMKDGEVHAIRVKPGILTLEEVEIIEGIDSATEVVIGGSL